jgi:hypothetical protein
VIIEPATNGLPAKRTFNCRNFTATNVGRMLTPGQVTQIKFLDVDDEDTGQLNTLGGA